MHCLTVRLRSAPATHTQAVHAPCVACCRPHPRPPTWPHPRPDSPHRAVPEPRRVPLRLAPAATGWRAEALAMPHLHLLLQQTKRDGERAAGAAVRRRSGPHAPSCRQATAEDSGPARAGSGQKSSPAEWRLAPARCSPGWARACCTAPPGSCAPPGLPRTRLRETRPTACARARQQAAGMGC